MASSDDIGAPRCAPRSLWERRVRVAIGVVACLGAACKSTSERTHPYPRPPRLVVLIVVDQLRGDELARHGALLRAGLRRLLDEGRVYTRALHQHARTETATGHATIATGLYPRDHGVVDKEIYDDERGRVLGVCDFGTGPCSPAVYRAKTLGDRLKDASPASKVAALAEKSRSAMLLGGHRADLVVWTEPWSKANPSGISGRSATGDGAPDWLRRFSVRVASPERINRIWEVPRLPASCDAIVDDAPYEIDVGSGRTFPHQLPHGEMGDALYWAWLSTPDSDRALVDMTEKVAQRLALGADDVPDLLEVSFGGFDAIGHNFGPDSLERVAAITELDRQISDLLLNLTELVGPRLLVALTSDHGVAPAVEIARLRGHRSGRIMPETLVAAVEAALSKKFGPGEYVEALAFPFLKLKPQRDASHVAMVQTAVAALEALPVVRRAFAVEELRLAGGPLEQLFYRNAAPGRSGDIAIALEPYHAFCTKWRGQKGAEHGSPWEYDRHVPLILWGDGVTAGRVTREVAVIDLTRTLGDRLGVAPLPRGGQPLP